MWALDAVVLSLSLRAVFLLLFCAGESLPATRGEEPQTEWAAYEALPSEVAWFAALRLRIAFDVLVRECSRGEDAGDEKVCILCRSRCLRLYVCVLAGCKWCVAVCIHN